MRKNILFIFIASLSCVFLYTFKDQWIAESSSNALKAQNVPESEKIETLAVAAIPPGFQDVETDGARAAFSDFANKRPKYGVFGLIDQSALTAYRNHGVEPVLLGCLVGDPGSGFWMGYNGVIDNLIPSLHPLGVSPRLQRIKLSRQNSRLLREKLSIG
jgi:hypothetical protein